MIADATCRPTDLQIFYRKTLINWDAIPYIHYVSKNIPDIFSRNSRKHYRIFIMFGTCVTEKVSKQYIDIQFILDEENFNSRHGAQAAWYHGRYGDRYVWNRWLNAFFPFLILFGAHILSFYEWRVV